MVQIKLKIKSFVKGKSLKMLYDLKNFNIMLKMLRAKTQIKTLENVIKPQNPKHEWENWINIIKIIFINNMSS